MFFFSPSPQHSIPRSVWKALERDLHCISPKSLKRAKMIHHYAWSGKSFSPKNAAREKCLFLYVVWLVINEKVSLNIILISAAISLSEAFMFCLRHKPLNEGLWFQVGNQQVWVICPQTVSSGTRLTLLGDKNCCGWSVVCGLSTYCLQSSLCLRLAMWPGQITRLLCVSFPSCGRQHWCNLAVMLMS